MLNKQHVNIGIKTNIWIFIQNNKILHYVLVKLWSFSAYFSTNILSFFEIITKFRCNWMQFWICLHKYRVFTKVFCLCNTLINFLGHCDVIIDCVRFKYFVTQFSFPPSVNKLMKLLMRHRHRFSRATATATTLDRVYRTKVCHLEFRFQFVIRNEHAGFHAYQIPSFHSCVSSCLLANSNVLNFFLLNSLKLKWTFTTCSSFCRHHRRHRYSVVVVVCVFSPETRSLKFSSSVSVWKFQWFCNGRKTFHRWWELKL